MIASDLMVGDYLLYNGKPYLVMQVTGIVGENFMLENGVEDEGEPIPLTEEILINNGFRVVENKEGWMREYYLSKKDTLQWVSIIFWEDGRLLVRMETEAQTTNGINNIHNCDIRYVHQLQHCLKITGIDKEIRL